MKATGLLGDGDEESYATTLLDTLRNLGSRDVVGESNLEAKRRGEARNECPMPLADFGRRAWPVAQRNCARRTSRRTFCTV